MRTKIIVILSLSFNVAFAEAGSANDVNLFIVAILIFLGTYSWSSLSFQLYIKKKEKY